MKVDAVPKPSFNEVIRGQAATGEWSAASRAILAKCIAGGDSVDRVVMEALASLNLSDQESVYLTLLALFILEEAFNEYEDEFQLLVSNAKAFLIKAGIDKPAQMVKKFTLTMVEVPAI